MFISNDKPDHISGYITLNEDFQIEEFSGQINQILRKENLDLNSNFLQITESLKKNIRLFFENEVLQAIKLHSISHLFFDRKKSILTIAITPMNSGLTLISLEETAQSAKQYDQSLPEKLKEVLIRINPDMQIIYVSKNFSTSFKEKASIVIGKTFQENQLFGEKTKMITDLIAKVFQQQRQKEEEIQIKKDRKEVWWNILVIPETDPVNQQQSVLIILK